MTFTYTPSAATDITRVRYHIGDTVAETAIFSDEEITFAISEAGTWQGAVLDSIRSAMARLASEPDMQADWLKIDWRRSAEMWTKLLNEKAGQFGIGKARASSGGQHVYRVEGLQKEEPDWEQDTLP